MNPSSEPFQLTTLSHADMPRLAWLARIEEGVPSAHVVHGPWVETWDSGFVEGAWSGDFAEHGFDEATAFAGTGALVRKGRILFVAGTDIQARLYSTRLQGALLLSNSLAFLMEAAGVGPDPGFGYYSGEMLLQSVLGVNRTRTSLPTTGGHVDVHECVNLEILPDLGLRRHPKSAAQAPRTYHEYVAVLDEAIKATLENASDPQRLRIFPPVATISQGYDAPFVAAIARNHGCTRALTFGDSPKHVAENLDDSGAELGAALGMDVGVFHHLDFASHHRCSEAEFCVYPPAIDHPLASFEDLLQGVTLLTGSFGDCVLSTSAEDLLPDFRQTTFQGLCGSTMTDFRLRVGFINFPPLFIMGRRISDIGRISNSEEMRPWSVGGKYDRPIARRFLNEVGIPDSMFGRRKMGSAWGLIKRIDDLCETSRADFRDYLEAHPEVRPTRRSCITWSFFKQFVRFQLLMTPGRSPVRKLPAGLKRFTRDPFEDLLFHWGIARTRTRYVLPAASRGPSPDLPVGVQAVESN